MHLYTIHDRPDWYIARYRTPQGKYTFGIASTRLDALKDALNQLFN